MTIIKRKGVMYPIIAAALASLIVVAVWFTISNQESSRALVTIDMPSYSSVEELSAASDAVVIGTVKGVVGHEIDYGTTDPAAKRYSMGMPIVFYEVNVTDILKGETSKTIIVGTLDPDKLLCESVTALRTNEQVLLFLAEQTPENAPGIKTYDHSYATVSHDNGVFDVLSGDLVQPRMPEVFVAPIAEGSLESPVYSLQEVRDRIRAVQ